MHNTECRCAIGPSDIVFAGVYVCTFQPGKFTSWVSERVNVDELGAMPKV